MRSPLSVMPALLPGLTPRAREPIPVVLSTDVGNEVGDRPVLRGDMIFDHPATQAIAPSTAPETFGFVPR